MRPGSFAAAVVPALFLVVTTSPMAAELSAPLLQPEVEALVSGKTVHYLRKRDGAKIGWDFRSGGDVYYTTSNTTRNISVAGTYKVTTDGALCFKWSNSDKFLSVTDGCVRFRREGDVLHVVGFREPDTINGDVIAE